MLWDARSDRRDSSRQFSETAGCSGAARTKAAPIVSHRTPVSRRLAVAARVAPVADILRWHTANRRWD